MTSSDPLEGTWVKRSRVYFRHAQGALGHRTAASGCGTHPDNCPSAHLSASSHRTSLSVKRHSSVRGKATDLWGVWELPGEGPAVKGTPGTGGPVTLDGAREAKGSSRVGGEAPQAFPGAWVRLEVRVGRELLRQLGRRAPREVGNHGWNEGWAGWSCLRTCPPAAATKQMGNTQSCNTSQQSRPYK